MPLCFAYGINMDRAAMAIRCPRSMPVGPARLIGFRFTIMPSGYASVTPERGKLVHGLLWDLALADVAPLDRFEEVGLLYRKAYLPVVRTGAPTKSLVYVGLSSELGTAKPGYMERVIASAEACDLPKGYVQELRGWLPQPRTIGRPHSGSLKSTRDQTADGA